MARGRHQIEYYASPDAGGTTGEIYADMDAFTDEIWADNVGRHGAATLYVVLPPIRRDGVFVRGILLTSAPDLLCERLPELRALFVVVAYSMWSSFPWSERAEALCISYANPEREAWWRQQHPDRAHLPLLPFADSDWLNESLLLPAGGPKDIDVLCVARLDRCKNLDVVAQALRVLRRKYPQERTMMTLVTGVEVDPMWRSNTEAEREVLRQIAHALGPIPDYVQLLGRQEHGQMRSLYSRARVVVLGSLLEGKNRALLEAAACDTPVVTFAQLNQHSRGPTPIFADGAGLTAPHFDPESLADTLRQALRAWGDFRPRRGLLRSSGRRLLFGRLLAAFPDVAQALPDVTPGHPMDSPWLEAAIAASYHQPIDGFVFGRNPFLSHRMGLDDCLETLSFYRDRMA